MRVVVFAIAFVLASVNAWAQPANPPTDPLVYPLTGGALKTVIIKEQLLIGDYYSQGLNVRMFEEVLRIVGVKDVSSGTGTIRPLAIDADGDVKKDTNSTISTAGAWTWGGAGSFTSTLGVTGLLSGNTGTLLLGNSRVTTTSPALMLHDSDASSSEKYFSLEANGGLLALKLYDDTPSSSNPVFQLDRDGLVPGDWRWGSLLGTIRPENNGGTNLGSLTKKYLTLHAWELWVDTLVARDTIATIGGRVFVAPTTKLTRDLASGDGCLTTEHNNLRTNDTVLLQKDGKFEKILIGTNPIDCSISGNCSVAGNDFNYCSLTRNRDGTGANDWAAGDAVLNEGNTGDGYIDLYSDRSATSEGYPGQVISDGPVAYWRMNETTSTTTADVMGNVGVATETGTQSAGLGVLSTLLGTTSSDPVWQNHDASGYLSVANDSDLQITADLTIEWWMLWEGGASTQDVISRGGIREYGITVESNGALQFCHGNGSTFECEVTAASFVPIGGGAYHHYAIVRDATSSPKRILFYKDGVLASSSTYTQTVSTSTNALRIGDNPDVGGRYFDGNIDELAIYNYQLAADRILLHYNARLNNSISKFTIGPTLCGNVRTGTGAFDVAERWCLGNLAGTYGYASSPTAVYGFAAGNPSATWLSADATNGFRIMNGSLEKLKADTSGNLKLTGDLELTLTGAAAGVLRSGASAYDTDTGYFLEYNGGTPRLRIGTTTGAGTPRYLRWTGSALEVKNDKLSIDNSGIVLAASTGGSPLDGAAYRFEFGDALQQGLFGYSGGGEYVVDVRNAHSGAATIRLDAQNSAGTDAKVLVQSQNGGTGSRIQLDSDAIIVNGSTGYSGSCSAASFTVVNGVITSC